MEKETFRFEGLGKDGVRYTTKRTIVEFLLRPQFNTASITKVYGIMEGRFREGVKKEVIEIIEQFKKDYFPDITSLFCQVHRDQEMIMLYDAGMRAGVWGVTNYNLANHMALKLKNGSICMVWYANKQSKAVEIIKLDTEGNFHELATYVCEPKKALVSYIQKTILNRGNTWSYPDHIDGMYLLPSTGGWAFELANGDILMERASEAH